MKVTLIPKSRLGFLVFIVATSIIVPLKVRHYLTSKSADDPLLNERIRSYILSELILERALDREETRQVPQNFTVLLKENSLYKLTFQLQLKPALRNLFSGLPITGERDKERYYVKTTFSLFRDGTLLKQETRYYEIYYFEGTGGWTRPRPNILGGMPYFLGL